MIELFEQQIKEFNRHSSKGNQLKWENNGIWYKADYTGYEGLAEYVASRILELSSLKNTEYVSYETEEIKYRNQIYLGAKSSNFLTGDWQIITLERLFKNRFNESLHTALWKMDEVEARLQFLVEQTERITGITSFGAYMTKLFTVDALLKNEDRHTHNIAVLMNAKGEFKLCPIFDNGAALLADTRMDYPMDGDALELMEDVQAKTIATDFDEQLDAAERLYGRQMKFRFTKQDVEAILADEKLYKEEEKNRVKIILFQQMRKYAYLF